VGEDDSAPGLRLPSVFTHLGQVPGDAAHAADPALTEAGGPIQGPDVLITDSKPERGPVGVQWFGGDVDLGKQEARSGVLERAAGPTLSQDLDVLLEYRRPLPALEWSPEDQALVGERRSPVVHATQADADAEPAAGQDVRHGQVLGQGDRMVQGQ